MNELNPKIRYKCTDCGGTAWGVPLNITCPDCGSRGVFQRVATGEPFDPKKVET